MSAESKAPALFSAFYDATAALLRKNRENRLKESLKKTMATEERLLELSEDVARGRLTRKFLESDFWIDHMEPFLRAEAILKPANLREVDASLADRAYHEFLIGSGQVRIMTRMLSRFEEWQTRGTEAEKLIALEEEKRRRLPGGRG